MNDLLLGSLRLDAQPVAVAEEKHLRGLALSALGRFDPVAHPESPPQRLQEPERPLGSVGAIVFAHDGPDGV